MSWFVYEIHKLIYRRLKLKKNILSKKNWVRKTDVLFINSTLKFTCVLIDSHMIGSSMTLSPSMWNWWNNGKNLHLKALLSIHLENWLIKNDVKHYPCYYCLSPDSNAVGDPVSTLYKYSSYVENELTVVKISPYLTSLAGINLNFDNFCQTKKVNSIYVPFFSTFL